MQGGNRKRLFHRVFLGATLLWVLYCAVFVPVWRHRSDEAADSAATANCLYGPDHTASVPDADCMVRAEGVHVIHQTEWRSYYGPGWWLFLLAACAGLPALVYGGIVGSSAYLSRIRRLRRGMPPSNPDDQYA